MYTDLNFCRALVIDSPLLQGGGSYCSFLGPDADCDGTLDSEDACLYDSQKVSGLVNGCNEPENCSDSDGDGSSDCIDECPLNPLKSTEDSSGCEIQALETTPEPDLAVAPAIEDPINGNAINDDAASVPVTDEAPVAVTTPELEPVSNLPQSLDLSDQTFVKRVVFSN